MVLLWMMTQAIHWFSLLGMYEKDITKDTSDGSILETAVEGIFMHKQALYSMESIDDRMLTAQVGHTKHPGILQLPSHLVP